MGDPARFRKFSALVKRHLPTEAHIADIAGGRGQLQAALHQLGYKDVESWDTRQRYARGRRGYRYSLFDYHTALLYDAVVAMHLDGGTDHALLYALRHRVPALVCPCCVIPSAAPYGGKRASYVDWCRHLEGIVKEAGRAFRWERLEIQGRSRVLVLL